MKQSALKFSNEAKTKSSKNSDRRIMVQDNDISFKEFCTLCEDLSKEPSYNAKTSIVRQFIASRTVKDQWQGKLYILVKMLLPSVQKRVYNLKDKQIVKLFSQVFVASCDEMVKDLEKGNVSKTVEDFFRTSKGTIPCHTSTLSLAQVDELLSELAALTKEDEQFAVLTKIAKRCTPTDLKCIVRLIKHDLRMNTGAKHVLDALDANAYAAYQACSNLKDVVEKLQRTSSTVSGLKKSLSIRASLMTPVKPMLAEACKSISAAMKKCPNGMFAEIKYDGERVQVHKDGCNFDYFSRSLKAVQPHKVAEIKDYLAKACPGGDSLILDGEVLLIDSKTEKPLPFGTLGIHKKSKFKDATVCYVIFDILQFNDENVMKRPVVERRDILTKNIKEIKGRIMLSQMTHITREAELKKMLEDVFAKNLEGLVLKDLKSVYEPGKRHWLKMKKDYLDEGAMADTADLLVLGAYYGTGNKGGLMSVFLMGCYNPSSKKWVTVAKCGNGHDDKTIERLQKELKVKKISKDASKIPSWLEISKSLVPDFVIENPKAAPVWEITGAEFSQSSTHTANGISIRFPRVTRIRDDKDWKTATDLPTLQQLYESSKIISEGEANPGPSRIDNDKKVDIVKIGDRQNRAKNDDDNHEDEEIDDKEINLIAKDDSVNKLSKKRSLNEVGEGDSSPPNKKSKPICKYKDNCYQKSKDHLAKFIHPAKPNLSLSLSSSNVRRDLSTIFSGTKVFIADDVADFKEIKRYVIAYDGDIVDEYHLSDATHFVTNSKKTSSLGVQGLVVNEKWIWDSVKNNTLQLESNYSY